MDRMFCPPPWQGPHTAFERHDVYDWVKKLPTNKKIYCGFWQCWDNHFSLPLGYDCYILSYHVENVDIAWLTTQQEKCNSQFIILHSGCHYDFKLKNTTFITYTSLHFDLDKMIDWWGIQSIPNHKKYRFSTICNRITQSKIWITTKLLETARHDSLVVLNSWLEPKNVHHWQLTGHPQLDDLTEIFKNKYKDLEIKDGFDQNDNNQRKNSNPYQPVYTDCALHFVNGSFHYSLMNDYIYPGPDIDEKTLKCLLAGVPFVPCAQFQVYKFLSDLGLEFNYDFDTQWDLDPGNMTRFDSICRLIDSLTQYSTQELVDKTKESTEYNRNFILSKKFHANCQHVNQQAMEQLMTLIS